MNTRAVLHLADLPGVLPQRPHPLWFGIVGLIAIESTVFASFLAVYFYLGMSNERWPPADVGQPQLLLPTLNVLLLSSGSMIWSGAWRGAR